MSLVRENFTFGTCKYIGTISKTYQQLEDLLGAPDVYTEEYRDGTSRWQFIWEMNESTCCGGACYLGIYCGLHESDITQQSIKDTETTWHVHGNDCAMTHLTDAFDGN